MVAVHQFVFNDLRLIWLQSNCKVVNYFNQSINQHLLTSQQYTHSINA